MYDPLMKNILANLNAVATSKPSKSVGSPEASNDMRDILERFTLAESGQSPASESLDKNQIKAGQRPANFKPKTVKVLGSKTDPKNPMSGQFNESLSNPVPYQWVEEGPKDYVAVFRVDNRLFKFFAQFFQQKRSLEVKFSEVDGAEESYGTTGKGGAQQVFATVIQIIKDLVAKTNSKQISLTAKGESRKKLYLKFIRKYLPGWHVHESKGFIIANKPDSDISESLDTPVPYVWRHKNNHTGQADFVVDKRRFKFNYDASEDDDGKVAVEVSFRDTDPNADDNGYGMTGKGGERAIFSTVMQMIIDSITTTGASQLIFSAGGDSRRRLYRALMHKYLPGWTIETEPTPSGNGEVFIVTKPDSKMAESLSKNQKSVNQLSATFKPKTVKVLGSKTDPKNPMAGKLVGGCEESIFEDEVSEDLLSDIRRSLNDYLKDIDAIEKRDDDLKKKEKKRDRDLAKKEKRDRDLFVARMKEDPTQQNPVIQPKPASLIDPTYSDSGAMQTPAIDTSSSTSNQPVAETLKTMECNGKVFEIFGDEESGFGVRHNGKFSPSRFRSFMEADTALELFAHRIKENTNYKQER